VNAEWSPGFSFGGDFDGTEPKPEPSLEVEQRQPTPELEPEPEPEPEPDPQLLAESLTPSTGVADAGDSAVGGTTGMGVGGVGEPQRGLSGDHVGEITDM
jgi:hypothetical protein